jgi:hypothetical protein
LEESFPNKKNPANGKQIFCKALEPVDATRAGTLSFLCQKRKKHALFSLFFPKT